MSDEFVYIEAYRWDWDLENYVLSARVRQREGCLLLKYVRRHVPKPGERRLECPVLAGELVDCAGCQWHTRESS